MAEFNEFTLVFEGDIREFPHPYRTETPFGTAFASSTSNAFDRADELESQLEEAVYLLQCLPSEAKPDQGWAKGILSYAECDRFNRFMLRLKKEDGQAPDTGGQS